MEFASIFAGLGARVTVLHRGDQVLRNFDVDLRDGLAEAMDKRGVDIRINTEIARVDKDGTGYRVHCKNGGQPARRSGLWPPPGGFPTR